MNLEKQNLVAGKPDFAEQIKGISLWVEPADTSDPTKLDFSFTVNDFTENKLSIELSFENPTYVSQFPLDLDNLLVELNMFED